MEKSPNKVTAARPPPTTSKTVFGLTSSNCLIQNPRTKNPGIEINKDKLLRVEKLFAYELIAPINETCDKTTTGKINHRKLFLCLLAAIAKMKPAIASKPPAKPKMYEILPKLNAVKATTSSIKKVIIDLFLTKKLSFIVISIISICDMFRYLKF